MEILDENNLTQQSSSREWWAGKRLKYNKGLIIAGIAAFIAYAIVGSVLIAPNEAFEITLFTTFFQGIGYVFMMGIANVFYFLGPLADNLFNDRKDEKFRQRLFNLGYWFSFGLPFLIPALFGLVLFPKALTAVNAAKQPPSADNYNIS